MKLGNTTPTEDVEEAPVLVEDESPTSLLEDVLNEAAAKASATEDQVKPAFVFDQKAAEFMSTHRIGRADIGLTPMQVLKDLEGEKVDPTEDEEAILDALIFRGRYEKTFRIGKAQVVLTTFSSHVERHAQQYIQSVAAADSDGVATAFNAMIVARSLVSVGGRVSCSAEAGTKEFESKEAFAERVEFVLSLPTDVLDAIGIQVNAFLRATNRATSRKLSDF